MAEDTKKEEGKEPEISPYWWKGLLFESGNNTISTGRIGFWMTFLSMFAMWIMEKPVGDAHLTVLGMFMAYNFGKKIVPLGYNWTKDKFRGLQNELEKD